MNLRQLSESNFRTGNKDTIRQIANLRIQKLYELSLAKEITANDLNELDRIGRFTVAQELLSKCSEDAKALLLNDHPHVKAAAEIRLFNQQRR
ncbi:hypothetical protein [Vibrio mediterranei]|uniref:hypothetical protein n=1 Tax=Vibrio mediterranei TaxID=689 RepID=UPI0040678D24